MAVDLGNMQWLVVIADVDTPPEFVQYNNRIVGVPVGVVLPPFGQIDSITIQGITLWGYLRPSAGGYNQWVMGAAPNANQIAIDVIPGIGHWTLTGDPGRAVYYELGQALLGMGVSGVELRAGLKRFYDAAVADYVAAVHSGAIPPPTGP
jgi:hypothetical protein